MTIRKASLIAGTIGFLVAVTVSILWTYVNAGNSFSLGGIRVLQDFTLAICPPSIWMLANENSGPFGTLFILILVAVQNFTIYFFVAALVGLLYKKMGGVAQRTSSVK